jgi:hypothetical protein
MDEKLRSLNLNRRFSPRSGLADAAWSDDSCSKSLVEEIMRLRD